MKEQDEAILELEKTKAKQVVDITEKVEAFSLILRQHIYQKKEVSSYNSDKGEYEKNYKHIFDKLKGEAYFCFRSNPFYFFCY